MAFVVCQLDACNIVVVLTPPTERNLRDLLALYIVNSSFKLRNLRPCLCEACDGAAVRFSFMDLTIAENGEPDLSWSTVVFTGVQNCQADKLIALLEWNSLDICTGVGIDNLLLTVVVKDDEASHVIVILLDDIYLFDRLLLKCDRLP